MKYDTNIDYIVSVNDILNLMYLRLYYDIHYNIIRTTRIIFI